MYNAWTARWQINVKGIHNGEKMLHFYFCCVLPREETLWGHTVYKKRGEGSYNKSHL